MYVVLGYSEIPVCIQMRCSESICPASVASNYASIWMVVQLDSRVKSGISQLPGLELRRGTSWADWLYNPSLQKLHLYRPSGSNCVSSYFNFLSTFRHRSWRIRLGKYYVVPDAGSTHFMIHCSSSSSGVTTVVGQQISRPRTKTGTGSGGEVRYPPLAELQSYLRGCSFALCNLCMHTLQVELCCSRKYVAVSITD